MKKFTLALFLSSVAIAFSACDTLQQIANEALSEPTTAEIGQGLKEALSNGITKGVNVLSATDGYFKSPYKILLPAEVRKVTDKLKSVPGFTNLENELLEKINRGAEDAAKEAGPIFMTAIKSLTFQDALNILMGADNAATQYLNKTSREQIRAKFLPIVKEQTAKVNLAQMYDQYAGQGAKLGLVKKEDAQIDNYVTRKALDGLYTMIGEEEKKIRQDPVSTGSAVLKKVFGALK